MGTSENPDLAAPARFATARRLGMWAVAASVSIVVLVPAIFDPSTPSPNPQLSFYPVKFGIFMQLSAVLLVAVLGAALLGGRRWRVPLLIPALAFLGISALSALLSGDLRHTLVGDRYDGLLSLAAGVLLFYAAARFLDSWGKVRVFLVALVFTATVVSVYGIVQHFGLDPVVGWDVPWYDGTLRAFSTIGNPIHLTSYLALTMGATAALYFLSEARWEKALWMVALALIGACWLYAYARGAMLGLGVASPVILWLSYRKTRTVRPLLVPLGVLTFAVLTASAFSSQGASGRVTATEGDSNLSAVVRLYIWRDTIPMILERPLLGHGPDNFAAPFERHKGEDLEAAASDPNTCEPTVIDKAHNEFLQVAATTGLLGLAAYGWIFVSYFRSAYASGGWPIIVLSGGVLAYVLQIQTAFSTITANVTFWAVLGLSVAIMRLRERGNREESSTPSAPEYAKSTRVPQV